jgi:hypothetical protein
MTTTTALDTRWAAVRAGLSRGWIETRQNLTETVVAHSRDVRRARRVGDDRLGARTDPAAPYGPVSVGILVGEAAPALPGQRVLTGGGLPSSSSSIRANSGSRQDVALEQTGMAAVSSPDAAGHLAGIGPRGRRA